MSKAEIRVNNLKMKIENIIGKTLDKNELIILRYAFLDGQSYCLSQVLNGFINV